MAEVLPVIIVFGILNWAHRKDDRGNPVYIGLESMLLGLGFWIIVIVVTTLIIISLMTSPQSNNNRTVERSDRNTSTILVSSNQSAQSITNEKDDTKLILIPGGEFLASESNFRVNIPTYYLAETPITNAQYKRFIDQTGYRQPSPPVEGGARIWEHGNYPRELADYPVVNVTWHDAKAYCEWAGLRLPTELEWEKGCRGVDGLVFPWGISWEDGNNCNCNNLRGGLSPVFNFDGGSSPFDLYQMVGNVFEWTEDWYGLDSRYQIGELDPPQTGLEKVIRGGAYTSRIDSCSCIERNKLLPSLASNNLGFRCAMSLPNDTS